jgi:hypothetical protein
VEKINATSLKQKAIPMELNSLAAPFNHASMECAIEMCYRYMHDASVYYYNCSDTELLSELLFSLFSLLDLSQFHPGLGCL